MKKLYLTFFLALGARTLCAQEHGGSGSHAGDTKIKLDFLNHGDLIGVGIFGFTEEEWKTFHLPVTREQVRDLSERLAPAAVPSLLITDPAEIKRLRTNHPTALSKFKINDVQVDSPLWSEADEFAKLVAPFHEMLVILCDDCDLEMEHSRHIVRLMQKRGYFDAKPSRENRRVAVAEKSFAELRKELVSDKASGADKEGMSFEVARKVCDEIGTNALLHYFFAVCTFYDKHWQEIRNEVKTYTRDVVLGYAVSSGSYATAVSSVGIARGYGYAYAGASAGTYYNRTPVIGQQTEYYRVELGRIRHDVWGVRVYGIGRLSELPEKVLVPSKKARDLGLKFSHRDSELVMKTCNESLTQKMTEQTLLRYYRAHCKLVDLQNGLYSYQIVSQNPLVPDEEI